MLSAAPSTLFQRELFISAINLKRYLCGTKQAQVPLLQIFAGKQGSATAPGPKLISLRV